MKVAVVILTSEKMPTHFHLMVSLDFLVLPLRNPAHVLLTCVCVNKVNIRIPLIFFFQPRLKYSILVHHASLDYSRELELVA